MKSLFIFSYLILIFCPFTSFAQSDSASKLETQAENVLEFFIAPPRKRFDWSTPRSTAFSFLGSRLRSHEINPLSRMKTALGHGMIHVSCKNTKGSKIEFWTGITGQDNPTESTNAVLKEKVGMAILFHVYKDGFIQKEEDILATLSSYYGRKEKNRFGRIKRIKPEFIQYKIASEPCDALEAFYETFKSRQFDKPSLEAIRSKKSSEILSFGLQLDPYALYLENLEHPGSMLGGGCTSYASSFLKISKIYDPALDTFFLRTISMTKSRLIGSTENPVPFLSLLFGKRGSSWFNSPINPNDLYSVTFNDPEKMYDFIDTLLACSDSTTPTMSQCDYSVNHWKTTQEKSGKRFTKVFRTVHGSFKNRNFVNHLSGVRIE